METNKTNIKTSNFRTKHEFFNRMNPKGKDFIIGLDAGYSGMKCFYENGNFCFPSFAKKVDMDRLLDLPNEKNILFKDNRTGDTYMIGYMAQNMIEGGYTGDTEAELFARRRYNNEKFIILCQAAIGIALSSKKDNREVFIETGLPSAYVKKDSGALKRALCKPADFSLRVGTGKWRDFQYTIRPENIDIIPQPAGSLYSAVIGNDGNYTANAKPILYKNTLVIDVGFGTFDFYGIEDGRLSLPDSLPEIGMRKVMAETSRLIFEEYGEDIPVASLQKNLESGYVTILDDSGDFPKTEEKPIGSLLAKANGTVFEDAMKRVLSMTNSLQNYNNLIVSGGTGEAWLYKIRERFAGLSRLQVIPSNINDPSLPLIYSNARGYYMLRYTLNKRG